MNYVRLGRGVGIGARIAGKALSKALEPSASPGTGAPPRAASPHGAPPRSGPTFQQQTKAVAHGARKFGEAAWGPFAHAGRALWLEVVGVFFALFALFFGQQAWARRTAYAHGAEHNNFLAVAVVCAMFVYLSATSFARSRRKTRKK